MDNVSHTPELLEKLKGHADGGDHSGYYSTLEKAGFRYGSLAGGVAREDSLTGRLANAYMVKVNLSDGMFVGPDTASRIREQIMQADLMARLVASSKGQNGELKSGVIARYHEEIFERFELTDDELCPKVGDGV